MNTVKLTKKDYFNGMIAFLNGDACDIPVADMVAFCDKEIASLDTRAAKAKERAAAKRAEGDDLMDAGRKHKVIPAQLFRDLVH